MRHDRKTVTIQIGNSDNKLSQIQWAGFVAEIAGAITRWSDKQYFFGGPPNYISWQNVAWVVEVGTEYDRSGLKEHLTRIRKDFQQDSVAWTEGNTELI